MHYIDLETERTNVQVSDQTSNISYACISLSYHLAYIHKDIHMHITVECMHVCVYICMCVYISHVICRIMYVCTDN